MKVEAILPQFFFGDFAGQSQCQTQGEIGIEIRGEILTPCHNCVCIRAAKRTVGELMWKFFLKF